MSRRMLRTALALVSGETVVSIAISSHDLKALKKLAIVSHHIADRVGNERAQKEQEALAVVLDETVRKIEIAAKGTLS